MNKEQTQAAIAVMQAFLDGKEIEYSSKNGGTWFSLMESQVYWNWSGLKYRVKPKIAKYRRFLMMHEGQKPIVCLTNTLEVSARYHEGVAGFIRWIDTEWQEEIV